MNRCHLSVYFCNCFARSAFMTPIIVLSCYNRQRQINFDSSSLKYSTLIVMPYILAKCQALLLYLLITQLVITMKEYLSLDNSCIFVSVWVFVSYMIA
mmetsp:Transcript_11321/g.27861  ORF Transcript_11321/g.27861 Transcript_11321/m.27861 type:complete len:98 (-) Transcript_11321:598-891(-)